MQHRDNPPVNKELMSQLMDGEWHELDPSECVKGVCSDENLRNKWARYHLIRDVIKNEPVQADSQLMSRICAAIADEPSYSNITSISTLKGAAEQDALVGVNPRTHGLSERTESDRSNSSASQAAGKSWLGTGVTGFALAASVAAVTVVGMNVWQSQAPVPPAMQATAATSVQGQAQVQTQAQNQMQTQAVASNGGAGIDGSNAFSQQVRGAPLPQVELVSNRGSYWVSPLSAERVNDEEKLNMFLSQHLENSPTAIREGLLPYSRLVGYDGRNQER